MGYLLLIPPMRWMVPQIFIRSHCVFYAIPSSETLCQRMDEIGISAHSGILAANTDMLKANGSHPTPLRNGMVSIDVNVSPSDNGGRMFTAGVTGKKSHKRQDGTENKATIWVAYGFQNLGNMVDMISCSVQT